MALRWLTPVEATGHILIGMTLLLMKRRKNLFILLWAWVGLWGAACTPQIEVVEVTREVVSATSTLAPTRVITEQVSVTRVVTERVTEVLEVTPPPPGGTERPLLLLFPPTYAEGIINGRSQALLAALSAATGQQYEIRIPENLAATVALLCDEGDRAAAFLPALSTVWAQQQCGAQPALVGERFEAAWHAGMYLIPADNGITTLADLDGKRWGIPGEQAVATYELALAQMQRAEITPAEIVVYNGESNALLALLDGEVDVVTASFNPPLLPYEERLWLYGQDSPELWRQLDIPPTRHPIGYVEVIFGGPTNGGYRIRDARAALFDIRPEIFDVTRILTLTDPIPNGALVLGSAVPYGLAVQLVQALADFGNSDACAQSICAPDFYNWSGMAPASSAAYAPVRALIQTLELDAAAIFAAEAEW